MSHEVCRYCGERTWLGGATDEKVLWRTEAMESDTAWACPGNDWHGHQPALGTAVTREEESVAQEVARIQPTSHNMTYVHSWKYLVTNDL